MLESAQALFGLERREEGAGWLRQAAAIAEGWDDESLKDWFAGKAKPLYEHARMRVSAALHPLAERWIVGGEVPDSALYGLLRSDR